MGHFIALFFTYLWASFLGIQTDEITYGIRFVLTDLVRCFPKRVSRAALGQFCIRDVMCSGPGYRPYGPTVLRGFPSFPEAHVGKQLENSLVCFAQVFDRSLSIVTGHGWTTG